MTSWSSEEELDEFITRPSQATIEVLGKTSGSFAVLGAGGKMGFHVSRMLQRALDVAGNRRTVTVVSRFGDPAKKSLFEKHGFHVRSADLSNALEVQQLPLADNVFFLAGVKFGTASNPALLRQMNIDMPRLVAEHYSASRIVGLSTGCVYAFAEPDSGGSTEMSPTSPPGDYAESCLGREQAFAAASAKFGTRVALIRLNYAVELRYGVLLDTAQRVFADEEVSVEMGYVNVIWQGDAIDHILRSLPLTASPPFILNVTGTEILSVRELAEAFAQRMGRTPRIVGQEKETAWLNNAAKAHGLFGKPPTKLGDLLDWISDWVQQGKPCLGKPTRFEVRDGDY